MIYNENELKREILILNAIVKAQTAYISDFKLKLEAEYQRGRDSILSRTCEGCKWDYTIANRDEDGNVIDDMFPSSCYICSRNMPDKWEQK